MSPTGSIWQTVSVSRRAKVLEARWQSLCITYLPRAPKDSIWRYARVRSRLQPSAGWKLHISATILNAPQVLKRIAPFLTTHGVLFKAPRSLTEVRELNAGLNYHYSQIGKIITVYPKNDKQVVFLAQRLHTLTKRFWGPNIPFDLKYAGNVYYRYGAFQHVELPRNGRQIPAVYAPDGDLVPDIREQPKPDWTSDPFETYRPTSKSSRPAGIFPFHVIKVLVQRGKGGVYIGVDFSSGAARLCLLKQGRKHGELSWDGRDGAWRVRHEHRVLSQLSSSGVPVPHVHSSFELEGNYYLVMEYLNGQTLHDKLLSRSRRLTVAQVLQCGLQLAEFFAKIHKAGWAWRDCKPKNIIVTSDGRLVPIDFEGAAPIRRPDLLRWGTPGFMARESRSLNRAYGIADDVYALGSMLFLLLTGRIYDPDQPLGILKLRRNVPAELIRLVDSLLLTKGDSQPAIETAHAKLTSIFLRLKRGMNPAAGKRVRLL
jgi:class IV lanthipeptide synthase